MTTSVSRSHFYPEPAVAASTSDRWQPASPPASATPSATANTLASTARNGNAPTHPPGAATDGNATSRPPAQRNPAIARPLRAPWAETSVLNGKGPRSSTTSGAAPPPPPQNRAARVTATFTAIRAPLPAQLGSRIDALQDRVDRKTIELAIQMAGIPSLNEFADTRIREQLAKDYPGADVDPEKTRVRWHYPSFPRTPGPKDTSLREAILENAEPWVFDTAVAVNKQAILKDKDGNVIPGAHGERIELDKEAIHALARTLDVGQKYTDMLQREFPANTRTLAPEGPDAMRLARRELWLSLNSERMQLDRLKTEHDPEALKTFQWQQKGDPYGPARGLRYIDAVLAYPHPKKRPAVDGHTIVASHLALGTTSEKGGGGQTVRGVAVIGTSQPAASPAVVLYTPDAPDNIAFRELPDMAAITALARNPRWKTYFSDRLSTNDAKELERITNGQRATAGQLALKPIRGNLHAALYRDSVGFMISHAKHRSTTNDLVDKLSLFNKIQFGVDVALGVLDLMPMVVPARLFDRVAMGIARRLRPVITTTTPPQGGLLGGGGGRNPFIPPSPPQTPSTPPRTSPPALTAPRPPAPREPASGPTVTTAVVHPQPQALASPSIKPYIQAAELIGGTKPSVAAIDRGVHLASNGRRYINLAQGTEDAAQVVEVVPTGNGLWQAHRDGAAAGPFFKFDTTNKHWSIVDNVELGPSRSKWGPPPQVEFTPGHTSPVFHRNLNTASARGAWNAADHVDMHAIQKAMHTELQIDAKAPALETISGRDLAKKMNIPYDDTNPGANPAAWTSPEGRIYVSRDAPDFVVDGSLDVDKIRSTVIHESIHSASANHTGLQAVTRQTGDVGLSALNYDEAAVDYFAHKVYKHLYPGQSYKSGYFVAQGTLWMGETVRFLERAGVMSTEQLKTALFRNPDLFKHLPDTIRQEWLAWGKSGPRAPTSSAPPGPKMPNSKL